MEEGGREEEGGGQGWMDGWREGGREKKESQQSKLAPGTHKKHKHTHTVARPPQKHTWTKLERNSVTSMLLRSVPEGGGGGAPRTSA